MGILVAGCCRDEGKAAWEKLNRQAAQEYLEPVRPGYEGRNPYWNGFAKKFIYAPAFGFADVSGAVKYRFELSQEGGNWSFEAQRPCEPLSKVWNEIPVGKTELTVLALDASGGVIDTAGTRSFLRDYPFAGPYRPAMLDYRTAAVKGALYNHTMPAVRWWRDHIEPDMSYPHNTYPCKIIGATIRNECLVARLLPDRREEALQIARNAAQFLVDQSRPEGDPLAFFPPTYYKDLEASRRDWNQGKTMVLEALSAAQAFMDLFDATGEQGWYDRALAITRTYAKLQREDGSLPVKADFVTGEPVNASCAMLHPLLNWLRRLKEQYGVEEFEPMRARAFNWMREVALERFDMTGQFEDVSVLNLEPYQNLTNCTAAPYASYLLRQETPSDRDIADARDLIRLSEDQFVHWDWPENPDGFKKNWTPCVHEQYHYEMPVDNSACNVANAWLDWFDVTGDRLAFEKAKALIDSITLMQNQNNGQLPTTWEWRPAYKDLNRTYWINCSFSSIRTLLRMAEYPL